MLDQLPYNCQINILLQLNFEDIKNCQELKMWENACKSVTVWRHLLNQSTQNCVILDSYIANAIKLSEEPDSKIFTHPTFSNSTTPRPSRTTAAVRLLEKHIQNHEVELEEFRNSFRNQNEKTFYEILRDFFFRKNNNQNEGDQVFNENLAPKVLLFGPDLSQTWIGIGNRLRSDTIKNLGTTINGGFMVKYLRGKNNDAKKPFILNTIFRSIRDGGSFDQITNEYFLDHRVQRKCEESDRILLCIRNTLPYKKTHDFQELRAQLKKMILSLQNNNNNNDQR